MVKVKATEKECWQKPSISCRLSTCLPFPSNLREDMPASCLTQQSPICHLCCAETSRQGHLWPFQFFSLRVQWASLSSCFSIPFYSKIPRYIGLPLHLHLLPSSLSWGLSPHHSSQLSCQGCPDLQFSNLRILGWSLSYRPIITVCGAVKPSLFPACLSLLTSAHLIYQISPLLTGSSFTVSQAGSASSS